MKVSVLGGQITVYDDDLNIVQQIPEKPPVDSNGEKKVLNILDWEAMMLGKDPDEKPDFFIDFETDERFKDDWDIEDYMPPKPFDFDGILQSCYMITIMFAMVLIGYALGGYVAQYYI